MDNMNEEEDTHLSGAFSGHFIPASFFLGFGLFFLGLAFVRASRGGTSALTASIPELDRRVVLRSGVTLMVCTAVGFFVEAIGGYVAKDDLWFQTAHETLYFLFFFAGVCALLEALGKLPPDASRCGVATALLGEYMLWYEHALMKTNMVDQRIHVILAQLALANSAMIAWSVYQGAQSVIAYVLGFALLVLQGMWLMTAAFNIGINEVNSETGGFLNHHNVGVIFCVEVVFVGFGLVIGTALVYPSRRSESAIGDKERLSAPVETDFNRAKTNEYEFLSHDQDTELPTDLDFT